MTNRLELNWKVDGFVDEQRYYCSEIPIDPLNLPVPKAILAADVRTYDDFDINLNKTYYVRIGSVGNGIEKISDEISVISSIFDPLNIPTIKIILDDEGVIEENSLNQVSKWIDRVGGYEFVQNSDASKPKNTEKLNGLGVKSFDASYIKNQAPTLMNAWNSVQNVWAFCVYKSTASSSKDKSIINITHGNGSIGFSAEAGAPAAQDKPFAYARAQRSSVIGTIAGPDVHLNDWVFVFYEINFTENSGKISVNGSLTTKENLWSIAPGLTQAMDALHIELGGISSTGYFQFKGEVASVMLGAGNTRVSDADRLKLEGYAAHKYGLADKLPSTHPYKTISP